MFYRFVVSPTSRRTFLYWLLLLVPTLVVGVGAIQLLRREQARLAERGAYADEARKAAMGARARLIVENIELLVGEVQAGLLDTLASEPTETMDTFLAQWNRANPLVRAAFRASAEGRVLWPEASSTNEEARGFLRRFSRHFGRNVPWSQAEAKRVPDEKREQDVSSDQSTARKEVAANVQQLQSARRDVQELFKNQNAITPDAVALNEVAVSGQLADAGAARVRSSPTRMAGAAAPASVPGAPAPTVSATTMPDRGSRREAEAGAGVQSKLFRAKDTADRRGWTPAMMDGRLHLFAWVQPGGVGDIRGVEVDLAALVARLGGALPAEPVSGEGYALRDEQGRVLHQAGAVQRGSDPVLRIPFATALLPGWDVTAYLLPAPGLAASGDGFFWVGTMLVAIFVAAILAGGSLLLWQARRSEDEATQKTSFVANVSHEFKTPLTTIRLYSELLEQGRVRDTAQGTEYLRTIGRETQRLARLVNNALDFSRLEQGRKKYARESIDLTAELGRLLDTHAPRVADAGLVLTRALPTSALQVETDRDAVEQIVLNLIDNACKYAAAGGELTVSLAPRGAKGAEIRVADRGPGVPPDHRERIFEKFHRVDDALTAEKTGAGLGLSIARQLARGLGGELRYAARAGAGAEFVLELP